MSDIDDSKMHSVRTETIDLKIDGLIKLMQRIDDRLYALLKTNPDAMKEFERIEELRVRGI